MAVSYKTKNSIIAFIVIVCFALTTLVCYAFDDIIQEQKASKKEHSFFTSFALSEFLCLPTDKLNVLSGNKEYYCVPATSKDITSDKLQKGRYSKDFADLQSTTYIAREIVACTQKKDGKK